MDWMELEKSYYMFTVRRQPIVLVKGQGTKIWDEHGKEYLDFVAGWAVNNLGHAHPVQVDAITRQAQTLIQTSNQFYTLPQLELAQLLVENSCLDKVFFANSGAEANEGAIKLARKFGRLQRNGAHEVITSFNSFHGRTLTMVAATGQPHHQEPFKPLIPGFVHVEYGNIEAIRKATTDATCAILLEPVQGEGGVVVPPQSYLQEVRDWCNQNNLLLIFDEIQTGLGRLGTLWGYESFDIEPDVITLAKGLGGGVPIGAFLAKEKCNVLEPGDHGSTFGGNPLTCAAAYATTKYIIEHQIAANAQSMGKRLKQGLEVLQARFEFVTQVRGMGLLLAVEFNDTIAGKILSLCNESGVLLNAVRPNAVRFMPPLTITTEEVDEGLTRFEQALARV